MKKMSYCLVVWGKIFWVSVQRIGGIFWKWVWEQFIDLVSCWSAETEHSMWYFEVVKQMSWGHASTAPCSDDEWSPSAAGWVPLGRGASVQAPLQGTVPVAGSSPLLIPFIWNPGPGCMLLWPSCHGELVYSWLPCCFYRQNYRRECLCC